MESISTTAPLAQEFPLVGWGDPQPAEKTQSPPLAVDNEDAFLEALLALSRGDMGPLFKFLQEGRPVSSLGSRFLSIFFDPARTNVKLGIEYGLVLKKFSRRGCPKDPDVDRGALFREMWSEWVASGCSQINGIIEQFAERGPLKRSALYEVWNTGRSLQGLGRHVEQVNGDPRLVEFAKREWGDWNIESANSASN
jgi:hypothetical protein